MTENRYQVRGNTDFFSHIEDTSLTEDKHEGSLYDIYDVVNLLNKQDNEINRLNNLVKIATELIEWNTIPQVRRQWEKCLKE